MGRKMKKSLRKPSRRVQYVPTPPPSKPITTFALQVVADSSGEWVGNQHRLPTLDLALQYGRDLAARWTAVRKWRVMKVLSDSKKSLGQTEIVYICLGELA
jgi:hypothetical protein